MQKASESCWNLNIPKVGYYPNFSPSFDIFSGDALCYAYFRFSLSAVLFFILFVFAIREATEMHREVHIFVSVFRVVSVYDRNFSFKLFLARYM